MQEEATKGWTRCDNLNHLRRNVTVRHCPQCGNTVNAALPSRVCDAATHAARRKQQSAYCVDCGTALIVRPPAGR